MTGAWLDPVLVLVAVCLVAAVWYYFYAPLSEMTGLTVADVADSTELPMWAVVVGGWSVVAWVGYLGWLAADWFGR